MMTINIKRAYEPAGNHDGYRVLVDRLWPRGIKKETLALDKWEKEIAPSTALRKWFSHDQDKWDLFKERYRKELEANEVIPSFVDQIRQHKQVTLLYGASSQQYNHAIVLKEYLEDRFLRPAGKLS